VYHVNDSEAPFRLLLKWRLEDSDLGNEECGLYVAVEDETTKPRPGLSVFNLSTRTYTKWFTDPEVEFMWFLNDSRARFNPTGTEVMPGRRRSATV